MTVVKEICRSKRHLLVAVVLRVHFSLPVHKRRTGSEESVNPPSTSRVSCSHDLRIPGISEVQSASIKATTSPTIQHAAHQRV